VLALPAPPAAAAERCAKPGTRTIAEDDVARVYARRGVLYGCLRSTGRHRAVARNFRSDAVFVERWSDVVLRGRWVAFTVRTRDTTCKADCPPDHEPVARVLRVTDLRTGETGYAEYDGKLEGVVLTPTGGAAYVLDGALWASDVRGAHELDPGPVEPESVRASSSLVVWTNEGRQRAALVAGGPTCIPRMGRTRSWNDVVRVFELDGSLYGCRWLRSRSIQLTRAEHDHVRASGRFVAWSEPGAVVVRDFLEGREVRPEAGDVVELALGGDGTVAWVQDDGRLLATRGTEGRELARGGIEPGSLSVRDGTVSWRQNGAAFATKS
jgi:hypothetical protein